MRRNILKISNSLIKLPMVKIKSLIHTIFFYISIKYFYSSFPWLFQEEQKQEPRSRESWGVKEMSVFGGDSWGREANYRKRRIDDLLINNGYESSCYKKLSSGKYACLVCPHNPILDTPLMLSVGLLNPNFPPYNYLSPLNPYVLFSV